MAMAMAWQHGRRGLPYQAGAGRALCGGGLGVGAGTRLSREGQEKVEVHLRLAPGGEDKGPGAATPRMVTTTGRSGRGGWGHGAGGRHSRQEARSGRVWPAAWRRTRGFALTHPPVLLYAFAFPASFSRRTKRPAGASIPRRI